MRNDHQPNSRIASAAPAPAQANPLDRLVVFDRLEVGPVRLETDRLTAPYRHFFSRDVKRKPN